MYKTTLPFVLAFLLTASTLSAQDSTKNKFNFSPTEVYAGITGGALEYYSMFLAVQDSNNFSYEIKWAGFGITDEMDVYGTGIGINYHTDNLLFFRYTSVDALLIYGPGVENGYALQWVVGNSKFRKEGIGFMIELGTMFSSTVHSTRTTPAKRHNLFSFIAKFGFTYVF